MMLRRRRLLRRLITVLSLVVLFCFGTHIAFRNGGSDVIVELQAEGRIFVASKIAKEVDDSRKLRDTPSESSSSVHSASQIQGSTSISGGKPVRARKVNNRKALPVAAIIPVSSVIEVQETLTVRSLQELISCNDRSMEPRIAQRSDYWVLYNYVRAEYRPHCWETLTYTTHADYTFLNNLETLLDRWQGPVSLALFAPGMDFLLTLHTIRYLRDCSSPLVSRFVTFHIYFPTKHIPEQVPQGNKILEEHFNCSTSPTWFNSTTTIYKAQNKLLYPVNVGRNIARESAVTHYIFPSDIELYPSPGLIPDFLAMIQRQDSPLRNKNPKVFVLSIFELEANMSLPANKKELVHMIRNGTAIPFHKKVCPYCHNVPKSEEWLNADSDHKGLRVFHIAKRIGYFLLWEPIFIGTHQDPLYDERLSWEGKRDKMTQGYTLCVLDYEFQILDNAFLVHKPGIKTFNKVPGRRLLIRKTNGLIRKIILPELKALYGTRNGCIV